MTPILLFFFILKLVLTLNIYFAGVFLKGFELFNGSSICKFVLFVLSVNKILVLSRLDLDNNNLFLALSLSIYVFEFDSRFGVLRYYYYCSYNKLKLDILLD